MILTLALKTPEHPALVRGAGEGATLTNFFRQSRRHRSAVINEDMTAYMNAQFQNMRQSNIEEIKEHVQQEYFHLSFQPHLPPCPPPHSGDDSCSVLRHIIEIPLVILFINCNLSQGILLINVYFVISCLLINKFMFFNCNLILLIHVY